MADTYKLTGIYGTDGVLRFEDAEGNERTGIMSPVEYLVASAIHCAGLTALSILGKMKIQHRGIRISGVAQMTGEDRTRFVESVSLDVAVMADMDEDQHERVADLTEKYCTIAQTLRRGTETHVSLRSL